MSRRLQLRLATLVLCAGLVAAAEAPAAAAGWTHEQGHFYLQLGTAFSFGTERYDNEGNTTRITVPQFSNNATSASLSNFQQLRSDLYFEVGALPRLTLIGSIPFISARQENPGGDVVYSTNSLGDIWVGGRYGLLLGDPFAFAIETRLGLPTGDSTANVPTGSGDFRVEFRFALSKSFDRLRLPFYFDVEMAYMARGAGRVHDPLSSSDDKTSLINFSPEIAVYAEVGLFLFRCGTKDRLIVSAAVDYRGATTKTESSPAIIAIYPQDGEYTTVRAAAMVFIWKGLGVMGRFSQVVEGLRLPKLTTVEGALFAKF